MSFSKSFLGRALSDKDEPSSKRLTGFIMIMFALVMEFFTLLIQIITLFIEGKDFEGGLGYDVFVTLLAAGLTALGISQFGKIQQAIADKKK